MKEKNKLLVRSRDRIKWKKNLAGKDKNEAKANAIYFRPNLADDQRIRELAALTGDTNNATVEKLVSYALNSQPFSTAKLTEQANAIRRLEVQMESVAHGNIEILSQLDEMRRRNSAAENFITTILAEVYCMVHTAVSLIRTVLLQILGFTANELPKTPPPENVLASFDETSNITIVRSLQDLEKAAAFHELKSKRFLSGNLFWKSKLRNAKTETNPEEKRS